MANGNLERLIIDLKESLDRDIDGLRGEIADFRREIISRFDAQDARLERHAALWQTGRRWSGRMDAWAEKVDGNASDQAKLIAELQDRVRQLERRLEKP